MNCILLCFVLLLGIIRAVSPHTLWRFEDVPITPGNGADPRHDKSVDSCDANINADAANDHSCMPPDYNKDASHSSSDKESIGNTLDNKPPPQQQRQRQTKVEVECIVDSKGSIPAWLINFMQKQWPHKALTAFNKLVKPLVIEGVHDSVLKTAAATQQGRKATAEPAKSSVWAALSLSKLDILGGGKQSKKEKKMIEPFKPVLNW
jgi:hypothetical protein